MLETVTDVYDTATIAQMKEIQIVLPKDTVAETLENGTNETIYLCDGYTVTTQVLSGGDMEKTFRELTGFSKEQLTVMQRKSGNYDRYDWSHDVLFWMMAISTMP